MHLGLETRTRNADFSKSNLSVFLSYFEVDASDEHFY